MACVCWIPKPVLLDGRMMAGRTDTKTSCVSSIFLKLTISDYIPATPDASHNYLRITRILKFLSIASYPHYAAPFVLHVLSEQSEHGLLNNPTLQNSLDKWWANCNRDAAERATVQDVVERVRAGSRDSQGENRWIFRRGMYEAMIAAREEGKGLVLHFDA
jgi:hypothetical protein